MGMGMEVRGRCRLETGMKRSICMGMISNGWGSGDEQSGIKHPPEVFFFF